MGCHCNEVPCVHHPDQPIKTRTYPDGIPSFLPQPRDQFLKEESVTKGGPDGTWATGRVMWTPSENLVGVRPIVDRYSIVKYNPKDWRQMNQNVLDKVYNTTELKRNVQCTIDTVSSGADKHQGDNTKRIRERLKEVRDCQTEVECLVKDFREEIVLLTECKIKLKFSLPALKMPETIAGECIDRRTTRIEPDLVDDDVEKNLIKELAMVKNTRTLYETTIADIERQILLMKAVKNQLEHNWSDKKETCELESINVCLNNSSPIITFHGGAARYVEGQSSPESWAIYNATLIETARNELNKSRNLRQAAEESIIGESVRNLSNQADKVMTSLKKRIEETDACREMFERELQDVLVKIAEAESLYGGLVKLQRQLDYNTKVVDTRLDNRLQRPRVENCRDKAGYGLLEEVKFLNMSRSDLKRQIEDIDKVVSKLYEARSNLEFVIMTKRKSLYVDQQRCLAYREHYPDAATLSGNVG